MVYSVHEKKDSVTGAIKADGRRKHNKHNHVSAIDRQNVIDHINSFLVVDLHYCKAKTNKKYLEPGLNIEKIYDLYIERQLSPGKFVVKPSFYQHIFNTSFNIGFHIPKTDRCDRCEEIKIKEQQKRKEETMTLKEKEFMRPEMNKDKVSCKGNKLMIVFDLQNVITLP